MDVTQQYFVGPKFRVGFDRINNSTILLRMHNVTETWDIYQDKFSEGTTSKISDPLF